jgi:S1-C subfamily serine protease
VVVLGVYPGSPAASAGIDVGDILLAADGAKLTNSEDLSKATFAHRIGDSMTFRVNRAGKVYDVKLVTGKVAGAVFGG